MSIVRVGDVVKATINLGSSIKIGYFYKVTRVHQHQFGIEVDVDVGNGRSIYLFQNEFIFEGVEKTKQELILDKIKELEHKFATRACNSNTRLRNDNF